MTRQLTFDLPVRPALGRGDFFVSPANALAVAQIDIGTWPGNKLLLVGPAGSGKSNLAQVWATECGAVILDARSLPETPPEARAVVVEDADHIAGDRDAETALFHLHNHVLSTGGRLMITGESAPRRWGITLPDLASRLEATTVAELLPPDDALLSAVLVKLFADRQITVSPSLIPWLVKRMDRSFEAAREMVSALDARALSKGKPISQAIAREVLDSDGTDTP